MSPTESHRQRRRWIGALAALFCATLLLVVDTVFGHSVELQGAAIALLLGAWFALKGQGPA